MLLIIKESERIIDEQVFHAFSSVCTMTMRKEQDRGLGSTIFLLEIDETSIGKRVKRMVRWIFNRRSLAKRILSYSKYNFSLTIESRSRRFLCFINSYHCCCYSIRFENISQLTNKIAYTDGRSFDHVVSTFTLGNR